MTSIKTLADKAILIQVSISCFTGAKKDKGATVQVVSDNNIDKKDNNVRVWKNLMKGTALNKVTSCAQKIRLTFYSLSSPWGMEGSRIIKVDRFQKVKTELEKNIREFYDAVALAIADYDNMIEADKVKLGDLYNPSDYPSKSAFAASFSAKINVAQIEKSDFRNDVLSEEDIKEINDQIAERIKENSLEVEKDLMNRVMEKLGHLIVRLSSDGKLHDSAVDNILETIKEARDLNVNENTRIDEVFDSVEKSIVTLSPDKIRASSKAREIALTEAKNCVKKVTDTMAEFMV